MLKNPTPNVVLHMFHSLTFDFVPVGLKVNKTIINYMPSSSTNLLPRVLSYPSLRSERERDPGNEVVLPHAHVGKYCAKLVLFLPTIGRSTPDNINWFQGGIFVIYLMHLIKKWKQNEIPRKAVEWLKMGLGSSLQPTFEYYLKHSISCLIYCKLLLTPPPPPDQSSFIGPPCKGPSTCKQKIHTIKGPRI